ncbi:hypothetical protein MMC30_001257 [Trapelia coarctata]|nr:hypothetical protein [Trapelia coarctata]
MLSKGKLRLFIFSLAAFLTILTLTLLLSPNLSTAVTNHFKPAEPTPTKHIKPEPTPRPPIKDNFPLAEQSSIPPIPSWNALPSDFKAPNTPLMISFTRNWPLLQQTVVSWITAGWPANQIFVIDNSGTQFSNRNARLTLQNPFYLNYKRLTTLYNVTVIETPALLTFAQLQNFFLHTALEREWPYYFWSHMDVVALSDEAWKDPKTGEFKSIYTRVCDVLADTLAYEKKWAIRFFAYDRLALYRTSAFTELGGWDPFISYYLSDCDMHERLMMAGYELGDARVGLIYDVSTSLDDLLVLYRRELATPGVAAKARAHEDADKGTHEYDKREPLFSSSRKTWGAPLELGGPKYKELIEKLDGMQAWKNDNPGGRNTWQAQQQGVKGEDFYYDPEGFQRGIEMAMEHGRATYREKWAGDGCGLRDRGLGLADAWKVTPE